MYRNKDQGDEHFLGYVNLGDTVGQSSLLFDEFDDETRIVADIESQIAVISRRRAVRLMFEIPPLRENLVVTFGRRLDRFFRGKNLKRFPKVVGVVSGPAEREFLPWLARELGRRNEDISVMTDRGEQFSTAAATEALQDPTSTRGLIGTLLAGKRRVLIDIMLPQPEAALQQMLPECDEVLWCCNNGSPDRDGEAMLARLADEYPSFRSRIVCVQMLAEGQTVGRRDPCCAKLVQSDLKLSLPSSADQLSRLQQQGLDRIVRHLRGIKIGLALGGGGARGMSHLGVLRVLDRAGISMDLMSGTSAGAMIGLGYVAGMPIDLLIDTFSRTLQPPELMDWIPGGRRVFLFAKFRERAWEDMLRAYYHDWTFQQLPFPFLVVATDLVAGEEVVRETGQIVEAILESINVPVMSDPILKDGMVLVDGGVLNNLPAELLSDRGAEFVIGVDASKEIPNYFAGNYWYMKTAQMKKPGQLETAYRVMEVSRRAIAQLQLTFADVVIEPDTSAFDFADFTAAAAIAEMGEAAAEQMLPEIQRAYDELMND
jgi:predicted acylesterase/phospholipase RssA